MSKRMIVSVFFVLVLGLAGSLGRADVIVAENLLVDLRAEDLPYGEGVATWPNRGSLGEFTANGAPIVEDVDGTKAVTFDGSSWFDGPTSPAGITGAGTRTMEVWAYNPSMPGEETMLSWAHRGGPNGSNMAFNYGNDNRWGSMGHWGGDTHDMGWWGTHAPAPAANTWWYLVYTYDGTAARVYVNGVQESIRNPIALNTHSGNIIRVAAQADDTGAGVAAQFDFTGSIAVVRIHDGVLSPAAIQNNFRYGRLKAWNPTPANGAVHPDTWVSLSWSPGGFAVSHDVYLSDDLAAVDAGGAAAFRGNQASPYFVAGFPGFPYPDGLVPGTTYYWRIDEVNNLHPDSPWRGSIWSFLVPPKKAYNPNPRNGAKFVPLDATLSWTAGFGAKLHTVYFGDDLNVVSNATAGVPSVAATYNPGPLALEKTYYWRVDEFDAATTHKGDVWSFTTVPAISVTDPNLFGWWKFDEGTGALALDWSGRGHHGTLFGGPAWAAGYDGGGLRLDGVDDYVALPIGSVISALKSSTFTTWVNFSNAGGAWQRIFDFGSGMTVNMFLTPRTDTTGPMRFAITIGGGGAPEEQSTAPGTLASGWHHVAVTINAATRTDSLYLDGEVIATNTAATLTPSSLGNTTNNWLGRSQYPADAYFNGALDDFRIYDYALSAAEIVKTMRGDPLLAWDPKPADGTTPDIHEATPLSWSPGDKAAQHDVYFGTDKDAVDNAGPSDTTGIYRGRQSSTSYTPPEGVQWGGGPYYWRIDQVNTDGTISKGRLWSFTVADFVLVDDFESYDAGDKQIWYSWHDGLGYGAPGSPPYFAGNGTGAAVGDENTASYAEETIVHSGGKSMPLNYDNKQGKAKYSEAELTLTALRDWTADGVGELSLWFRGLPASVGSFAEAPAGTYTMTASGTDIWDVGTAGNYHDEFHFAYKTLTGAGSIVARVQSVQNTDGWAKAGVMIRETLDGGSRHMFAAITPSNGVAAQGRLDTGGASFNANQTGVTAPYWVKVERDLAGNFTVTHSANGTAWQPVTGATPQNILMGSNVYIGLALTAHNAAATCQAVFTNITTTGTVSPQWAHQDIGIASNATEPLYVAVSNASGQPAVVVHPNPSAATVTTWTEWVVPLQTLANQGITLTNVDRIALGLGTRGNQTAPGSAGKMYFDDIRLYRPKSELK